MAGAAQELVHFPSFGDNGPGRSSTVLSGYRIMQSYSYTDAVAC